MKFKNSKALIIAVLANIIYIYNVSAQNRTVDFIAINHFFDSISMIGKVQKMDSVFKSMIKDKKFNGSILIAKEGKVLYQNYSGYADFETKKKLTASSQYEVASVSKQFTAVAILMLYEQNKLKLTDTVQKFIPDFPYKGITVHQLLCHRSGLPDYFKFAEKYHLNKKGFMDNDSLLNMMKKYRPKILEKPDKKFEYSNTGYAVLASIVERVSGISFVDFVKKNIFIPLGMKESYFYHYGKPQNNGYTTGHRSSYKHYERDFESGVMGDKGIFTTTNDLLIWDKALYDAKILKAATIQLAFSPKNSEISPCSNYGYGWRLSCDEYGNALVYHGGLWNGNNSLFLKRLSDKTLIIFLSNLYNKGFSGKSGDFLLIFDEL
jgi:CubicO group peptidase (beta-lactamase class C family)